jgi:tetratricopeptide (TPR) repeat protein
VIRVTHRFHKLELEASSSQQQNETESTPALGQKASAASEQLAELHDSSHWMQRAEQFRRAGEFEDALRYYSRAVELDRQCVAGWVGQVRMLVALEEYTEAELWARKALELFREANTYHNDGLFVKAVEVYKQALTFWDHPAINYNLALSLMNLDRPMEVEDCLKKSIKFGEGPLAKDKFNHAKEYLLLVQQQLATIDVTCAKPGAKVSVDGKEVFTVGPNGGIQLSKYEQNIEESVRVIIGTALGERQMRPDWGCRIHDFVFAPNNTSTQTLSTFS